MFTALWALAGCTDLLGLQDKIDDLTETLVAQAWTLGVEPVADDRIDLSGTDWEEGAAVAAFLASAEDPSDLADAPVEGATVTALASSFGSAALVEEDGGAYSADAESGFVYTEGEDLTLKFESRSGDGSIRVRLPRAASADIADAHTAGEPLLVSIEGQAYDHVLVVVVDAQSGDVVYDNTPRDIEAVYALVHGDASLKVEVPGSALAATTVYAVGVAGLVEASEDAYEGLNTALSATMAGQVRFYPVSTLPD